MLLTDLNVFANFHPMFPEQVGPRQWESNTQSDYLLLGNIDTELKIYVNRSDEILKRYDIFQQCWPVWAEDERLREDRGSVRVGLGLGWSRDAHSPVVIVLSRRSCPGGLEKVLF